MTLRWTSKWMPKSFDEATDEEIAWLAGMWTTRRTGVPPSPTTQARRAEVARLRLTAAGRLETLASIAARWGVSASRVRGIEHYAVRAIQAHRNGWR